MKVLLIDESYRVVDVSDKIDVVDDDKIIQVVREYSDKLYPQFTNDDDYWNDREIEDRRKERINYYNIHKDNKIITNASVLLDLVTRCTYFRTVEDTCTDLLFFEE